MVIGRKGRWKRDGKEEGDATKEGEFALPYSLLQARLYDIPTFKNALSAHKEIRNSLLEYAIFVFVSVLPFPNGSSKFKANKSAFLFEEVSMFRLKPLKRMLCL